LSEVGQAFEPSTLRDRWLRRGLAVAWILLFATCGIAVASTWDRLMDSLVRAPLPSQPQSPSVVATAASAGESAVAEARRLLDGDRPQEALDALMGVRPEEPVYPFSLQLREEASRSLARMVPLAR
jgi:hypothetical protein